MRNKIFTILGILLLIVTIGSFFLFDANIKQHSPAMGWDVLVAKTNIPEGTIIRNLEDAEKYFGVRRVTQAEAVPNSIKVNVTGKENESFLDKIKRPFTYEEVEVTKEDLAALVNKKITTDIYKNEQVLSIYLSDDITEFEENERFFAVPTSYIDSVGAEVKKDDYVDLWVHYEGKHEHSGKSEKIIEALKVVKVKGANNEDLDNNDNNAVPNLVIFKMTEEQIAVVRRKMSEGSLFLTKWGKKPDIEARIVLEEPIEMDEEDEASDMNMEEYLEQQDEGSNTDNAEDDFEQEANDALEALEQEDVIDDK